MISLIQTNHNNLYQIKQSYSKLKDALRVCSTFRGTYLDYRDKAEIVNRDNKKNHAEKMSVKPVNLISFSVRFYSF